MVLSELAEVSVPRHLRERRWRMIGVKCAECGFDEITLFEDIVVCAACCSRICVLCGRVEEHGCWWILPGVCSTHEGDPRLAKLAAPATAKSTLAMLN